MKQLLLILSILILGACSNLSASPVSPSPLPATVSPSFPPTPSPTPTVPPSETPLVAVTPVPDVFMAQLRIGDEAMMEALLVGTLIINDTDNCLKLQPDDEVEPILIVWQPDYFLHNDEGALQIVDRAGEIVAQVGDRLSLGGGEQSVTDTLQASLKEPIPDRCVADKVWRMGEFMPE